MTKNQIIIIGGGPSGLSAALTFGRAMINTLIINEEQPRHFASSKSHGYITADGLDPKVFLKKSKSELRKYDTVEYLKNRVVNVTYAENCFAITTKDEKTYSSEYLLIATGLNDNISQLKLDGLDDVYGQSIFPCPFCDGYENRNTPCALIVQQSEISNYVKTILHWSEFLTVFTNGIQISENERENILKTASIPIVEEPILKINSTLGKLTSMITTDGQEYICSWGILINHKESQNLVLPVEFEIERTQFNTYAVNEACNTTFNKLYVIGDAANSFSHVSRAVAEGAYIARLVTQRIIHS